MLKLSGFLVLIIFLSGCFLDNEKKDKDYKSINIAISSCLEDVNNLPYGMVTDVYKTSETFTKCMFKKGYPLIENNKCLYQESINKKFSKCLEPDGKNFNMCNRLGQDFINNIFKLPLSVTTTTIIKECF